MNEAAMADRATPAIAPLQIANARSTGIFLGALGVLAFSLTLPATRVAVGPLGGTVVGLGRAVVAALLASVVLVVTRAPLPPRHCWARLSIVAAGVVVGFPLFSALALRHVSSSHGAVIVGLLPAATAVMAVSRGGERPSPRFWAASLFGLVTVLAFAASQGAGRPTGADGLILLAVAAAAIGYAEGAVLARELGGWQVICWALLIALPFISLPVAFAIAHGGLSAGPTAWLGFAYVSVVSMFLGFFAWYAGLARGGIARVGQLQLAQPVLTLGWAYLLLGEHVGPATIITGFLVLASVAVTQRTRVARPGPALPSTAGVSGGSSRPT